MDASPFGRLSAELRNQIWTLAVNKEQPHDIDAYDDFEPGITRVCKQIRHECQLMFYAENEFQASTLSGDADRLCRWLGLLSPEKRKTIKRLTILGHEQMSKATIYASCLNELLSLWNMRVFAAKRYLHFSADIRDHWRSELLVYTCGSKFNDAVFGASTEKFEGSCWELQTDEYFREISLNGYP